MDEKFRHTSQGAESLFSNVAEVTFVLQGNFSVSKIGMFWEKLTKQVENLKMRGYTRIQKDCY